LEPEKGQIVVCPLEGERELELFVEFAINLDDGEASSLAIAVSRGWTLATDDRKGRRLATKHHVKLISTSELIHQWVNSNSIPEAAVCEILNRIQQFGKFRPRRTDSLYEWWIGLADSEMT
jgi:predicted nucleic acid-binding protein